jgi:hypothetical protein
MVKPEDFPVVTILGKDLYEAVDFKHRLKGYTRIAYEIYTLNETLKYGESADEADGERIYRQIWQVPGWPTSPSNTSAGRDFLDVINQYPDLTKDDIAIRIWDMRDAPCQNKFDPHKETRDVEQELILRHINQYNRAPVGNKIEQKRLDKGALNPVRFKPTVIGDVADRLFY